MYGKFGEAGLMVHEWFGVKVRALHSALTPMRFEKWTTRSPNLTVGPNEVDFKFLKLDRTFCSMSLLFHTSRPILGCLLDIFIDNLFTYYLLLLLLFAIILFYGFRAK